MQTTEFNSLSFLNSLTLTLSSYFLKNYNKSLSKYCFPKYGFCKFFGLVSGYFSFNRYKADPMHPPLSPGQYGTKIFLNFFFCANLPFANELRAHPPDNTKFS